MRRAVERLAELLELRPGEGGTVALMFCHGFAVGLTLVFLETPASSLFLARFDAESLPLVFLATAAASVIAGLSLSRIQVRCSPRRLFAGLLTVSTVVTVAFYIALAIARPAALIWGLMIWKTLAWTLLTLEFWALAGMLFHLRQGKRLFGLIGSGQILAGILGGFATPWLVPHLGALHLLGLAAAGHLGTLAVLGAVLRGAGAATAERRAETARPDSSGVPRPRPRRYLALFYAVTALGPVVYYFLEYLFFGQIEQVFVGEERLAAFFGVFYGAGQVLNLLMSVLLTGTLLTRFGLSAGLLSTPVLVAAALVTALAGRLLPGGEELFFGGLLVAMLLIDVLGTAMAAPAARILYQPLEAGARLRVQTLRESVVLPAATGLAGALLLVLPLLLGSGATPLMGTLLAVLGGWMVLALGLRGEYSRVLTRALVERRFRGGELMLGDASSLRVLEKELETPQPGAVLYCLGTLEALGHPDLPRLLIRLLAHPSKVVRLEALRRLEARQPAGAAAAVARCLEAEIDPAVRGAAVRTWCALAPEDGFDQVLGFLDAGEPELRQGALIGLLKSGGIDGVLAAGARLNELIAGDAAQRAFAARALGEVGISSFYRPLLPLLRDADPGVRRAAVRAAGRLANPAMVPPLIEHLALPATAGDAATSLVACGDAALHELEAAFDEAGTPGGVRQRIVRVAGRIGTATARAFLCQRLDEREEDLRGAVLQELVRIGYRASDEEVERFERVALFEAEDAAWTLATRIDLEIAGSSSELCAALDRELDRNVERILQILAFLHPADVLREARIDLGSAVAEHRARALEVLEHLLTGELKAVVLALLDDLDPRSRLQELGRRFPQQRLDRTERLCLLLERTSEKSSVWTKACVLWEVGHARQQELEPAVVGVLTEADPFLRETAVWALAQLRPGRLAHHLAPLVDDPAEPVARLVRWLLEAQSPVVLYGAGELARRAGYRSDLLERLLLDEGSSLAARRRAVRILGSSPDPQARWILVGVLVRPDSALRGAALAALEALGAPRDPRQEREVFRAALRRESAEARRLAGWLEVVEAGSPLARALTDDLEACRWRQIRVRGLLEDGAAAPAGEVGSEPVAASLLAVLEAVAVGGEPRMRPWTRACAFEHLGRTDLPDAVPLAVRGLADLDATVRETAWWALACLSTDVFQAEAKARVTDPHPEVARWVERLSASADAGERK